MKSVHADDKDLSFVVTSQPEVETYSISLYCPKKNHVTLVIAIAFRNLGDIFDSFLTFNKHTVKFFPLHSVCLF